MCVYIERCMQVPPCLVAQIWNPGLTIVGDSTLGIRTRIMLSTFYANLVAKYCKMVISNLYKQNKIKCRDQLSQVSILKRDELVRLCTLFFLARLGMHDTMFPSNGKD